MAITRIEPAENEFLAGLEAKARQPNVFFRVMANRPDVLKSFVPLFSAIMGPGSVERRIKMLLYLVSSIVNRCPYCISANMPAARKAGVSESDVRAIERGEDGAFAAPEWAAIAYARELTRTSTATAATRQALRTHFNDEQIVEITLVIALSNFTNRFNNGLEILPEAQ